MNTKFKSRTSLTLGLLAACAITATIAPRAHAAEADPRVKKALNAAKLEYEVNKDKEYEVVLSFTGMKRSQLTYVASTTSEYSGSHWREVYSYAYSVKGKLSAAQANKLLEDNDQHPFGAWGSSYVGGKTFVFYTASISADASAKELFRAISLVSSAADEMEESITKKDDL